MLRPQIAPTGLTARQATWVMAPLVVCHDLPSMQRKQAGSCGAYIVSVDGRCEAHGELLDGCSELLIHRVVVKFPAMPVT